MSKFNINDIVKIKRDRIDDYVAMKFNGVKEAYNVSQDRFRFILQSNFKIIDCYEDRKRTGIGTWYKVKSCLNDLSDNELRFVYSANFFEDALIKDNTTSLSNWRKIFKGGY